MPEQFDAARRQQAAASLERMRAQLPNPRRAPRPVPHLGAGRLLVPQRYVIGWPDGIVKIGETWHGRRRWGKFIATGGTIGI